MKVFKFGGASIKDEVGFERVSDIIFRNVTDRNRLYVVISAIGKTTNKLEIVVRNVFEQVDYSDTFKEIQDFHFELVRKMSLGEKVQGQLNDIFQNIILWIEKNNRNEYNFIYDQIVSKGEILSSTILSELLVKKQIGNRLLFANELIITDSNYTDANINWETTQSKLKSIDINNNTEVSIIQGFCGGDSLGNYTTLGREGSDYTASILCKCLESESVTIWKDVNGIYTSDPNKFDDAQFIPKLSYREAIEMTYYGAQVIHPKTIKPLQNTKSELRVRSFINLDNEGSVIGNFIDLKYAPITVHKDAQVLFTFSEKDLSFVNEKNIAKILSIFGANSLRINCMQNTAVNFLVLTDNKPEKLKIIRNLLESEFIVTMEENLNLLTIRHYTEDLLEKHRKNPDVKLVQKSRNTIQYVH